MVYYVFNRSNIGNRFASCLNDNYRRRMQMRTIRICIIADLMSARKAFVLFESYRLFSNLQDWEIFYLPKAVALWRGIV